MNTQRYILKNESTGCYFVAGYHFTGTELQATPVEASQIAFIRATYNGGFAEIPLPVAAGTITQVNVATYEDRKKKHTRFTVYTDGKARAVADREYLTKHNIFALDFKCASWSRVGNFAARMEAAKAKAAVEAAFGVQVELVFSQKAGCACGCSPGFVGTIVGDALAKNAAGEALSRASIWVDCPVAPSEDRQIEVFAAKQALGLPAEIAAGNAKVEAEKAAQTAAELEQKKIREARLARWAAEDLEREQRRADESMLCANI